jgi:hypothetical protein
MANDIIDVKVTGLDQEVKRITKVRDAIYAPDIDNGVRKVATVWQKNFIQEGSKVGGWRQLALMTQKTRRARGYNPRHPILQQSGALRRAVITALKQGPSSAGGPGIRQSYSRSRLRAQTTASGKKAENQYRVRGRGRKATPARPFWFVDGEVDQAFSDGIEQALRRKLRL